LASTIASVDPAGNVGEDPVRADYEIGLLGSLVVVACLEDTLGADDQIKATGDAVFSKTHSGIVKVYEHGGR
jgi:hypothetical protein